MCLWKHCARGLSPVRRAVVWTHTPTPTKKAPDMKILSLLPFKAPARGTIAVPGSKSINNRALLLAALADGTSMLTGALDSDDTRIFAACLKQLRFDVTHDREAETFIVVGCGGNLPTPSTLNPVLFVGNAGTAARFLLAMCALGSGPVRFDGVAAMRKRPMGDLLDLLVTQGATASFEGAQGHFPLTLNANGQSGGALTLDPRKSSQQVSAALMVAPFAKADTVLTLTGDIVSEPYIAMTIDMMADWGVVVERPEPRIVKVARGQTYQAKARYGVEPDASSASYFFAAAAVTGGCVTIPNLSRNALQGDALFVDALAAMGAKVEDDARGLTVTGPAKLNGTTIDMNAISDTAPTLAAIAANASSPTLITGVEHMRWKETDRVKAMVTQLAAMGADIEERQDGMLIKPSKLRRAQVATYDDHRMAMSLAIAGIANDGVDIEDPDCTSKTFPTFFEVLAALRSQSGA
jgi:3-phosphoshikimate 1-carboxyvinyltransferase